MVRFKRKYKVLLFLSLTVIAVVLVIQRLLGVSIIRAFGLRAIDNFYVKLTCIGQNKEFMTWGFLANPVCVTTYPDAGKLCSSSKDCLSGMCVRAQNNPSPYCRGISSDYPLCSNGEATIEQLKEPQEGPFRIDFLFCD